MADNAVDVSRTLYRSRKMHQAGVERVRGAVDGLIAGGMAAAGVASSETGVGLGLLAGAGLFVKSMRDRFKEAQSEQARGHAVEDLIMRGRRARGGGKQAALSAERVALGQKAAGVAVAEMSTPTVPNHVAAASHTPHTDRAALASNTGSAKRGFQNPNNLKAALLAQGKKAPA